MRPLPTSDLLPSWLSWRGVRGAAVATSAQPLQMVLGLTRTDVTFGPRRRAIRMNGSNPYLPPSSGTYALILELPTPTEITVGSLGPISFDAPFYLYVGSAFGPGGVGARLRHHLRDAVRPHWHIDYLRRAAGIRDIWVTQDERRLECEWYLAATRLRGASSIAGFGSSDCTCPSHLVALPNLPPARALRHRLPTGRPLGSERVARALRSG